MKAFLSLTVFLSLFTFPVNGQILDKIKKVKDKVASVTIDKLSQDPITTSFKDVDKTKHFDLNFGDNQQFASFFEQPFDPTNGFELQPGFYEGTFQSFCIKAGTTTPVEGRGRFYAPIKGPKADIFTAIIQGYQGNSNITQREVQLLLWAIIAKTNFDKMKGPVKATALKLLSPQQIARLSKGALDKLTRNELRKVANQDPTLRAILEAENNLRNKFYSGARTYQEYEEIAMVAGVEPIVAGWEAGRWTQHPDGYFIRYFPNGYQSTRTQVYIPKSAGRVSFNPATTIAVPPNRGQRLLQTNLPNNNPSSNTGGTIISQADPFCEPVFNTAADRAIRDQIIMQNIPGVAVAIFQNGKMIHLKAYGVKDVYGEDPITLGTRMKWASISKSVTGVVAAQLEERKMKYNGQTFKVTDLVTDYVDNWDKVENVADTSGTKTVDDSRHLNIKIEHLLTNYGGVQQYGKGSRGGENEKYTLFFEDNDTIVVKFSENVSAYGDNDTSSRKFKAKEAVNVFNKSVLDTTPGTNYLYSSYGFVLAGAALDQVTPSGYWPWVKDNIKGKAGLRSMTVGDKKRPGHHMNEDGLLISYDSGYNEWTLPAGGFESNICDLAKYAYALSSGAFFEDESNKDILWNNSIARMKNPARPWSGWYSYGLNFIGSGTDYRGAGPDLKVWHGGHGGNVRSHIEFYPSDSTGIAIIAPAVYADLPRMAQYILQELNIHPAVNKDIANTPVDWCRSDMESTEDLFHGIWRKTGDDVLIRTGYEKSAFFNQMEMLKANGYEVTDIETYKDSGKRYWDAVLKKGLPDTKLVSDITLTELRQKILDMKASGYIPVDIESYIAGNSGRLWGAVFSKQNIQNKNTFKLRTQELVNENQTNAANGMKLIDIESYPVGNVFNWHGVWVPGGDTELEVGLKPRELFDSLDSRRNNGYKIADLEFYMLSTQEWRVGVIWEKSTDDEFISGEVADVDGDGDDDGDDNMLQSFCDHMADHHNLSKVGYELIDWERIDIEVFDD